MKGKGEEEAEFGERQEAPPSPPGIPATPPRHNKQQRRDVSTSRSPKPQFAPSNSSLRNVECSTPSVDRRLATQHDALPEAAPAIPPSSAARTAHGQHGRPGESHADDGATSEQNARSRRLRWWHVSGYLVRACAWWLAAEANENVSVGSWPRAKSWAKRRSRAVVWGRPDRAMEHAIRRSREL
jgi:hypothetical protein